MQSVEFPEHYIAEIYGMKNPQGRLMKKSACKGAFTGTGLELSREYWCFLVAYIHVKDLVVTQL